MDSSSNIHTIVKAQIVFLLSTVTEENFEKNQAEIRSLSEQHGVETYLHFIRRLILHPHSRLAPNVNPANMDANGALQFRLLVEETQRLARDPFIADRFKDSIDKGEGEAFRQFSLSRFADRIGLTPLERLILYSPVWVGSARKDLASQAAAVIQQCFDDAVVALCKTPCFEQGDLHVHNALCILSVLITETPKDHPVLEPSQVQALVMALQTKFGTEAVNPALPVQFQNIVLKKDTTLAQALVDLGLELSKETDLVDAIFRRFGFSKTSPPNESQVLDLISNLSSFALENTLNIDATTIMKVLGAMTQAFNWAKVVQSFDRPDRSVADTATLKFIISILLGCPADANPHAVEGFWTEWKNAIYQLHLLEALVSLPSDTFNFVLVPGRRIVTVDDVASASPTIKALAANVQGQTWNCLPLFETLMRFGNSDSAEIQTVVHEMLEKAIRISAELVHMGLLQVPKPWNSFNTEYASQMLAIFLAGHPNHQLVFMRIWQIDQNYLTQAFIDFYNSNQLNITRILDIAQDLKILETLLDVRPFTFALDVAALASRREYLNLDKWLADNITNHKAEFLRAVMEFLDAKTTSEKEARVLEPPAEPRTMALNPQTIAIFLRVLRNNSALLTATDVDYCLEIRNACLQIYPRLMSLVPGSDQEPGFSVTSYSTDIEKEVDGLYRQMYEESMSVEQVIAMLQRLKTSKNSRDHEVFACMLHFLFDEFRFFSTYPPPQLALTAYLFGSLIQVNLVDYIPLGIAIRYVLDALQCPPESTLFKFAILALARFETRLPEWQPLCHALVQIPHLQEARPELVNSIRRMLNESDAQNGTMATVSSTPPQNAFQNIQLDMISDDEYVEPAEETSDKILFIINNLAPSNFESKVQEMKERFEDVLSRWFAKYLVDRRVSTEPNNHQLYKRFLESLDRKNLWTLIIHETLAKSSILLNAESTQKSTSERAILKNLGAWLGAITLGRDKPIKYKNIAFKEFLLEGYDTNRLIVAIPFVCKILEGCAKSKVFKPPNPWVMAVISLLAELYQFAELKLNLKFEIEVLCKTLDLDLEKIEATTLLRNRPMMDIGEPPIPEYLHDMDNLPIQPFDQTNQSHTESQIITLPAASDEGHRAVGSHIEAILTTLANSVTINQQLAPFNTDPSFKRGVQAAVDQTVREIIVPVVERSVTIAGISTRELVTKDFAMEPNEEKMRKAAHLMTQKLSGSLAIVTCKEPLRNNLGPHLRHFLGERGFGDILSEQVIAMIVLDNLEAACGAVEKAAMERAVVDIDEALLNQYEMRRRHRETRSGLPFWDSTAPNADFSAHLPDPLRIKASGLQWQQWRVYEDFFGFDPKRKIPARPSSTVGYNRNDHTGSMVPRAPAVDVPDRGMVNNFISQGEATERFAATMSELEAIMPQLAGTSLSNLPPNHDLRLVIRQPLVLVMQCTDRHKAALQMSQRIVQHLYKTQHALVRDICVAMLEILCRTFQEVQKEATEWLIYAEDERKFNVPVTVALLRSGLISPAQQDQQLARLMWKDPRPSLTEFTVNLIKECLTAEPPIISHGQFTDSTATLIRAAEFGKLSESALQVLEDLRIYRRPRAPIPGPQITQTGKLDTGQLNERLYVWFQQWVGVLQRSLSPEKAFIPFVSQLQKEGILKQEDVSFLFFRVCTEASVESYSNAVSQSGPDADNMFQAIDALSKLIALIIRYHGDQTASNNDQLKAHYLTKILSIVVVVLAHAHEEQEMAFQQKPFFRFFSSLLNDLHAIESHVGTAYFPLMLALSDTFSSLQPIYFPGFAFSWMSLISHRLYLPKLLLSENRAGWAAFHTLIISMFKFLSFFLKGPNLKSAGSDLYRGASRILLLLLHDFPDFLSEYYFSICDVIPPNCIQLRNVVLSAFPPNIVLPDPYLRSSKLESLPEMGPIPPVLSDFTSVLHAADLRSHVDQLLLGRASSDSLPSLKDRLRLLDVPDKYDLSTVNALVTYIGVSTVAQAKAKSGSPLFVATDPGVFILQYLAYNLDVEGQHHLLSGVALHLRYPNAHTHWFSSLIIHLFANAKEEKFREVTTKILLERFIGHRPHPWGVLATFIELLRNPKCDFWNRDFVRAVPEIHLLLDSVARSMFPS